jgi:hypothetical protein
VGLVFVFLIIVEFKYLKIKSSKNYPSPILLFLGDLKNHLGLSLKNPKKGDYEVGAGVRVCD